MFEKFPKKKSSGKKMFSKHVKNSEKFYSSLYS